MRKGPVCRLAVKAAMREKMAALSCAAEGSSTCPATKQQPQNQVDRYSRYIMTGGLCEESA